VSTCRWPDKIRYDDQAAAKRAITDPYRHGKGNPDLNAYQCGDHWHIGHNVIWFKQRIKRSLRGGRNVKSTYRRRA